MKLPLYLYTNKNIAGCICALVAVIAYLAGIVHDFWWEIAIGAYAVPALAIPGQRETGVSLSRQMSDAEVVDNLKHLADRCQKLLPPDTATDVVEICGMLETAIPAISGKNYPDQLAHDVRTTATEYLPQTIDAYLRMPPAYRNIKKVQDGKTATQVFGEQVTLLKSHLQAVVNDLATNDANALLANGRFLREKFASPEFLGIA
jgi:hypothetical protein